MNWTAFGQFITDHPIATFGLFVLCLALIEGLVNVLIGWRD